MDETGSRKHDRFPTAIATIAISAAFAAPLTYFTMLEPGADVSIAPGLLRLAAAWLMFTILLAAMFAVGVWRMTWQHKSDEGGISPLRALIVLAVVIGLCALSPIPVFLLAGLVDTKVILYGVLALCVAFVLAAVYFFKR